MGERFRLDKDKYESIVFTVCGLVRLRIKSLVIERIKDPEIGKTIDVLQTHIFSSKLNFDAI
jgi:hypothetical protein